MVSQLDNTMPLHAPIPPLLAYLANRRTLHASEDQKNSIIAFTVHYLNPAVAKLPHCLPHVPNDLTKVKPKPHLVAPSSRSQAVALMHRVEAHELLWDSV